MSNAPTIRSESQNYEKLDSVFGSHSSRRSFHSPRQRWPSRMGHRWQSPHRRRRRARRQSRGRRAVRHLRSRTGTGHLCAGTSARVCPCASSVMCRFARARRRVSAAVLPAAAPGDQAPPHPAPGGSRQLRLRTSSSPQPSPLRKQQLRNRTASIAQSGRGRFRFITDPALSRSIDTPARELRRGRDARSRDASPEDFRARQGVHTPAARNALLPRRCAT